MSSLSGLDKDDQEKTNLIVNYLPQNLTDDEFHKLFTSIGPVVTTRVIRDRETGYSHGYGFVQYECAQDAARAITELDKIPVEHKKLKVAYSKPNGNAKNFNLYVSGLPPDATETTLKSLFEKCGKVIQCNVIKDKSTQLCSGICFVLYSSIDDAKNAISTLSNRPLDELSGKQMNIKFARNDNNKSFNYGQNFSRNSFMSRSMQYNQMSMLKERYSPMMAGFYPGMGGYYGNQGYMGGRMHHVPGNNGDQNQHKVVFVYGIGPFTNNIMLRELFGPIGHIVSIDVMYDHHKQIGKGYAFVTFSNEKEANEAVRCLDKQTYQGRVLQVSIKS